MPVNTLCRGRHDDATSVGVTSINVFGDKLRGTISGLFLAARVCIFDAYTRRVVVGAISEILSSAGVAVLPLLLGFTN